MKPIMIIAAAALLLAFSGCEERLLQVESYPPSAPKGLQAYALDKTVELTWYGIDAEDLDCYNIYWSFTPNGGYEYLGSTKNDYYFDRGVTNGTTYYYKISACDWNGNESALSKNYSFATPRPEGIDVGMKNFRSEPELAGYDFSSNSVGPYDDKYTDIYFEYYGGISYLDVWDDTEIQDMGYTDGIDEIAQSPTRGWSPTKDVQAIAGHTYVVRTWDDHYAKIRVISVSASGIIFDWAYQTQTGNSFLKISGDADRGTLCQGAGPSTRPRPK